MFFIHNASKFLVKIKSCRSFSVAAPLFNTIHTPKSKIRCTLIPGDGEGLEIADAVKKVFKAASFPIEFEEILLSEVNPKNSVSLQKAIESIEKNRVCLQGIIAYPNHDETNELLSYNTKMRIKLDLYANLVHVTSLPGIPKRFDDVDCVIIREQTDGEYASLEHESVKGMVECLKITTAKKSLRIAKFAFDYATKNNRKKVTAVHKANIMKLTDGLFLKCCEEIAPMYPKIKFNSIIVDNCSMQIVSNPQQFDVMVTPNLYGVIINNIAAGLVGGAGVLAGASYSPKCAIFEPGARLFFSAESAGKGYANPTAMLLASAKLLRHVNLLNESLKLREAVTNVLKEGKVLTKDVGGTATTSQFADAVIKQLK